MSAAAAILFISLVSSANEERIECFTFSSISLIMIRNRTGPKTEPWGTPLITVDS